MDRIFLGCFVILVIIFWIKFDHLSNFQFALTLVSFLMYLGYLFKKSLEKEEFSMTTSENRNVNEETSLGRFLTLPARLSDMMSLEIDQLISTVKGKKDPNGQYTNEESIDLITVNRHNAVIDEKEFDKIRQEYFLIDKVFRDLAIFNPTLYKAAVFDKGNM